MTTEQVQRAQRVRARVFSFAALIAIVSGVGYLGHQSYRAFTDSFVAPIILSPDNDLVIANKVKLSELQVERTRTEVEGEAIDGDLAAGEKAVARLQALSVTASSALAWMTALNSKQVSAGTFDMKTLSRQNNVLADMLTKQEKLAGEAKANADAGLITRADYSKELQSLNQVKLAILENERTAMASGLVMQQAALTQRSLTTGHGGGPALPEAIVQEDQMVRIELDLLKLEAEMRGKRAERRLVNDKLAKIDEIEGQLKARPLFKAIEKSMDIAFIPYTQMDGVEVGGTVYDCVWGLFSCKAVGTVTEIVPGEVILPDPWGNQARGQYAILELQEHKSAKSKTLRVRQPSGGYRPAQPSRGLAVSVR